MQGGIGANTVDHKFIERLAHFDQRGLSCVGKGDQLANQAVVVRRYCITTVNM